MARQTQLLQLLAQLRAETGRDQSVAVGVSESDNLKEALRMTQERLYEESDWQHLRVQRSVALLNGVRYYDFPTDLNPERIELAALKYDEVYQDICYGIQFADYTTYDSNASTPEESVPARKWDVRHTGTTEQIEIWPIPSEDGQTLYFTGIKTLSALVQEADRADLDDRLIVLFAAANILSVQKSANAQLKLSEATARLNSLKKNYSQQRESVSMLPNRPVIKTNIIIGN